MLTRGALPVNGWLQLARAIDKLVSAVDDLMKKVKLPGLDINHSLILFCGQGESSGDTHGGELKMGDKRGESE